MKVVTWIWRGKVMSDYYLFPWLQFSKHFEGVRHWSYTFYWKGSHSWYINFKKHYAASALGKGFKSTRLTFRLSKHIIVIGRVDRERYYKDVHIIRETKWGKVIFEYVPPLFGSGDKAMPMSVDASPEDIQAAIEKQKRDYEHLDKAYPENTWRN